MQKKQNIVVVDNVTTNLKKIRQIKIIPIIKTWSYLSNICWGILKVIFKFSVTSKIHGALTFPKTKLTGAFV